jgi:hypothetical protein
LDEIHNHLHAKLVTAMDGFLISQADAHVILRHISDQSVEFRLAGSRNKRTSAHALKLAIVPDEAYGVVTENRALLQRLLAMNIGAEKPKMAPSAIAEMVLSFFSGLCIERNIKSGKTSSTRTIENFMTALRGL